MHTPSTLKSNMTNYSKFIFFSIAFCTFFSSCTVSVPCDNGNIKLGFVSFSDNATRIVILRQYKKSTNFKSLVDTVLIDKTSDSYKMSNDSLQIEYSFNSRHGYTSSKHGLTSEYDYEVYLPTIDKTFQISDITEEYKMQKKGFTSSNSDCDTFINAYSVDGKKFIGEFRNLTIFFNNVSEPQCVDSIMSKIFFSANLSKGDSSLINYFKEYSKFSSIDDSKVAKFTTQYELDTTQIDYKYKFTSLPICNYNFPRGELTVVTTKNNKKYPVVRLKLEIGFISRASRDSMCRELATLFKKCSLDDFEPLKNAPSEFHVGVYSKKYNSSIIIAEAPEQFYNVALILFYFE